MKYKTKKRIYFIALWLVLFGYGAAFQNDWPWWAKAAFAAGLGYFLGSSNAVERTEGYRQGLKDGAAGWKAMDEDYKEWMKK